MSGIFLNPYPHSFWETPPFTTTVQVFLFYSPLIILAFYLLYRALVANEMDKKMSDVDEKVNYTILLISLILLGLYLIAMLGGD